MHGEWKATLDEWGLAAGVDNDSDDDSDDDPFGLFDHALPSQNGVIADAEEEGNQGTGFTHVSLVGASAGERYCFPGAGQPPDFLVPVRSFQAEKIINNYLVRLLKTPEGWAIQSNGETGEPTLSPSLVIAFIGKDGQPYQYGCLAEIANEEGMVFVMFEDTPLPLSFEEKGCRIQTMSTPRASTPTASHSCKLIGKPASVATIRRDIARQRPHSSGSAQMFGEQRRDISRSIIIVTAAGASRGRRRNL